MFSNSGELHLSSNLHARPLSPAIADFISLGKTCDSSNFLSCLTLESLFLPPEVMFQLGRNGYTRSSLWEWSQRQHDKKVGMDTQTQILYTIQVECPTAVIFLISSMDTVIPNVTLHGCHYLFIDFIPSFSKISMKISIIQNSFKHCNYFLYQYMFSVISSSFLNLRQTAYR